MLRDWRSIRSQSGSGTCCRWRYRSPAGSSTCASRSRQHSLFRSGDSRRGGVGGANRAPLHTGSSRLERFSGLRSSRCGWREARWRSHGKEMIRADRTRPGRDHVRAGSLGLGGGAAQSSCVGFLAASGLSLPLALTFVFVYLLCAGPGADRFGGKGGVGRSRPTGRPPLHDGYVRCGSAVRHKCHPAH